MEGWYISQHTRQRMREHGITEDAIFDAIREPVRTSSGDGSYLTYYGERIRVVADPTGLRVATVKPSWGQYNHPAEPDLRFKAVEAMAAGAVRADRRRQWSKADARRLKREGYSAQQVKKLTGWDV